MPGDGSVTHWLSQLASEETSFAERELFERYFGKLVEVARQRLQAAPRTLEDEEDLALSAMNSFFRRARQGGFERLRNRHELWALLVTIACRKVVNQFKRHSALKRGGRRAGRIPTNAVAVSADELDKLVALQPTPEMLVHLVDEFNARLQRLNGELLREVAMLTLQGYTNAEIAAQLKISERTVRRKLYRIRREWTDSLD
jgi:RNA polymerase sigma factor (sigma-70 family)